jgi:hypothetical protein
MSTPTAAGEIAQKTFGTPNSRVFSESLIGEDNFRSALLIRKPDGKFYAKEDTATAVDYMVPGARFAGVLQHDAETSPTAPYEPNKKKRVTLNNGENQWFKAGKYSTQANALADNAFLLVGSGTAGAVVLADVGKKIYLVDGGGFTVDPEQSESIHCGYIVDIITVGTSGDGKAYVELYGEGRSSALENYDRIGDPESVSAAPERVWHIHRFGRKIGVNADLAVTTVDPTAAEVALVLTLDHFFEGAGTNYDVGDSAVAADGLTNFYSHGGASDTAILFPHADTNQGGVWKLGFSNDSQWRQYWKFKLSTVTSTTYKIGATLTAAAPDDVSTDADQVVVTFVAGTDTNFQVQTSINGTDSGKLTLHNDVAPAATTFYELVIDVDASRVARVFIRSGDTGAWTHIATTAALKTAVDLKPYAAVKVASAGGFRFAKLAMGSKAA